ncbi:MAG: hypothetical protein EA360_11010 [Balneolaceae bacterium]|nr:MAG: hypothetical protein EA360_11010 [Balneolaceae bacterium]
MKLLLKITLMGLLGLIALSLFFAAYNMRDRFRGYEVNIKIPAGEPGIIRAGFAALSITPEIRDTWIDSNGSYRFEPKDGDTYEDVTGTGRFDAVWMAGFQNSKPAQGVHDDLWARAMVLDDGNTKVAWVVLDAIGFFGDDVIRVRQQLPEHLGIDYAIVSSTHTHSAPDLMGLWGPGQFRSGVNREYLALVIRQASAAIELASERSRPAHFRFAVDADGAASMLGDTRKPYVMNPAIRLMQAIDAETDSTLGTLAVWDNHPETIWNKNLLITSDFPHYFRKGLEEGLWLDGELKREGFGGTAIFAIGNIGGLMTTHPSVPVECPFTGELLLEPSFEKVRAQGYQLASLSMDALGSDKSTLLTDGSISLHARTVHLPLGNPLFRLGAALGLFDRGMSSWMKFRSEIAYWTLGPASFLHHPAELYPEIAYGGIESPEGQDFALPPLEVPPLKEIMHGEYRFMAGLSNDMIGYVLPKSQWDATAPYTYGYESRPYGEINSLGPDTGPLLHQKLMRLILSD